MHLENACLNLKEILKGRILYKHSLTYKLFTLTLKVISIVKKNAQCVILLDYYSVTITGIL